MLVFGFEQTLSAIRKLMWMYSPYVHHTFTIRSQQQRQRIKELNDRDLIIMRFNIIFKSHSLVVPDPNIAVSSSRRNQPQIVTVISANNVLLVATRFGPQDVHLWRFLLLLVTVIFVDLNCAIPRSCDDRQVIFAVANE